MLIVTNEAFNRTSGLLTVAGHVCQAWTLTPAIRGAPVESVEALPELPESPPAGGEFSPRPEALLCRVHPDPDLFGPPGSAT